MNVKFLIIGVLVFSFLMVVQPDSSYSHTMRAENSKDQVRIEDESFSRTENQFSSDTITIKGKIRNLTDKTLQLNYLVAANTLHEPPKITSSNLPYTTVNNGFFEYDSFSRGSSFVLGPHEVIFYTVSFESPEFRAHLHTITRTQDDTWRYSEGLLIKESEWQMTKTGLDIIGMMAFFYLLPTVPIACLVLGVYYGVQTFNPLVKEKRKKSRSGLWYLLPAFLAIIGGLIAYGAIRSDDPKKARNCLILGIIVTVGPYVAGPIIFLV